VRQRALSGIGESGQRALADARVAIVGVGGLGCPSALYLAAAGVGSLTLIDSDCVSITNLHRQVLFGPDDVGSLKVEAAARRLAASAPWTVTHLVKERLVADSAESLLAGHDIILDGTDMWSSRYAVADAAARLGIPLVWGAVQGWFGQVCVFDGSSTLRDVFPVQPPPELDHCDAGGVFGPLCGQVGTAMASQAAVVLTGAGEALRGRMTVLDARDGEWRTLPVARVARA
jgi:molybdopterin/thiamine biosynthesis adenylyltransferase